MDPFSALPPVDPEAWSSLVRLHPELTIATPAQRSEFLAKIVLGQGKVLGVSLIGLTALALKCTALEAKVQELTTTAKQTQEITARKLEELDKRTQFMMVALYDKELKIQELENACSALAKKVDNSEKRKIAKQQLQITTANIDSIPDEMVRMKLYFLGGEVLEIEKILKVDSSLKIMTSPQDAFGFYQFYYTCRCNKNPFLKPLPYPLAYLFGFAAHAILNRKMNPFDVCNSLNAMIESFYVLDAMKDSYKQFNFYIVTFIEGKQTLDEFTKNLSTCLDSGNKLNNPEQWEDLAKVLDTAFTGAKHP